MAVSTLRFLVLVGKFPRIQPEVGLVPRVDSGSLLGSTEIQRTYLITSKAVNTRMNLVAMDSNLSPVLLTVGLLVRTRDWISPLVPAC